jgi:hypothetical protein
LLFEGAGAKVRTGLYKQFEDAYVGAVFLVASNQLPACEAAERDEDFMTDIWGPITTRTDFVCLTTRHKHDDTFPYTVTQLAHGMNLILQNPFLLKDMEAMDEE